MIKEILEEREKTHGNFKDVAHVSQDIKYSMENNDGWAELSAAHQEALQMIASKIARIISGDAKFKDHWLDISGYAQLIVDLIDEDEEN